MKHNVNNMVKYLYTCTEVCPNVSEFSSVHKQQIQSDRFSNLNTKYVFINKQHTKHGRLFKIN